MNEIGQKIMAAIDRSLAPAPPRDAAADTIKAALKGQSVCSAEDRKRIQELDRQYGQAYQTVLDSDYPHAKQAFIEHQRTQVEMIAAGNFNNENFWTLEDFKTDFIERQQAGKRTMFQISVAAQAISKSICQNVARILIEQADQIDQADKEQYSRYSVPFTSGPLSLRLRQLAAQVLQRVSSGGMSRPAHYAGYLIS